MPNRPWGQLGEVRTVGNVPEQNNYSDDCRHRPFPQRHPRPPSALTAEDVAKFMVLIAAVYRAQADALEIEAQAKRRLADEYDAAQERGEGASAHDGKLGRSEPERLKPTAAEIGLSRKDIHEARIIRDAEKEEQGLSEIGNAPPAPQTDLRIIKSLRAVCAPMG